MQPFPGSVTLCWIIIVPGGRVCSASMLVGLLLDLGTAALIINSLA